MFLMNNIDEIPSLTLDQVMEALTTKSTDLNFSKAVLYNFMKEKCRISLKKIRFHSVERNSPENIERRYAWIKIWLKTRIDYLINCIFIDEATSHINMERTFAWPKKGGRAEVARAKATTILGIIYPLDVVNVEVKRSKSIKVHDVLKGLLSSPHTTAYFFLRISLTWLSDAQDFLDESYSREVDIKVRRLPEHLSIQLFNDCPDPDK